MLWFCLFFSFYASSLSIFIVTSWMARFIVYALTFYFIPTNTVCHIIGTRFSFVKMKENWISSHKAKITRRVKSMTCSVGKKKLVGGFRELYAWVSQGDPFSLILLWTYISFIALHFRSITSLSNSRELVRQILHPFHMRTDYREGKIWLKATFRRQLGCHPGLQTPSESRTLTPKSGISNVWFLVFREKYLLISLKTQHSWVGKCEGRGKDDRDVSGREHRSEENWGRGFGEKASESGLWSCLEGQKRGCLHSLIQFCQPQRRQWGL